MTRSLAAVQHLKHVDGFLRTAREREELTSTAVRECADGVCAEDTRRCWFVLAAASSRTFARMAERNCGGAIGREEGIH